MSNLNPNDPVIAMLKELVGQYDARLEDLGQAIELMMTGTSQALAVLKSRVMALETELDTLKGTGVILKDTQRDTGVEL
jgi:cell division protein FtsB